MPFGYHGCYLRIDVSRRHASNVCRWPKTVLRQFLGGSGLGAWLLLDEGGARLIRSSPEAPLVFAFSPLVGSPLTTSAKFAVVSKSPLTERINDSLASSGFAMAGKRCGCDAIVIVGRAPELSVLVIDDGDVRLESADGPARRDVPGDRSDVEGAARRRTSGSRRSARPASTRSATPRSRTTAATPAAAAAARCWAARTSRRSPCAAPSAASGRIRAS